MAADAPVDRAGVQTRPAADALQALAERGRQDARAAIVEDDQVKLGWPVQLAGVARSVAASNVTINFLLPGTFDTERLRSNITSNAKNKGISFDEAKAERIASVPARRFGQPDEFGAACAFLCSAQAGYITGQNLLIDGGAFPGAL